MRALIHRSLALLAFLLPPLAGCGGDDGPPADAGRDAVAEVAAETPGDARPEIPAPDGGDAGDGGEAGAEDDSEPVLPPCAPPPPLPPPVAPAGTRFALSLYHYNVQYVPGGLRGFRDSPVFDLGPREVEDAIVRVGLEPVLDLHLRHPSWGVDLEMQGYMVEIMALRHPDVLAKLRTLTGRGQADLHVLHFGDSLYLAYPGEDLAHSFDRGRRTLEAACVRAAGAAFSQEGQSGEGALAFLAARGLGLAAVSKNLYRYLHQGFEPRPLYRLGDAEFVLAGQQLAGPPVDVRWLFFDDGEKAATYNGERDPYFGTEFRIDPEEVARFEAEIAATEAEGFAVVTLRAYREALRRLGVEPAPAAPLLDCTWQPQTTRMMARWMGGAGLFVDTERDNDVLTTCVRARHAVAAARIAVDHAAGRMDVALARERLGRAERALALGQVSDACGLNPIVNEVRYGLAQCGGAGARAEEAIDRVRAGLGWPHVEIDTEAGTARTIAALPGEDAGEPAAAPLAVRVETERPFETSWRRMASGAFRLDVDLGPAARGRSGNVAVGFPAAPSETLEYSAGLLDGELRRLPWSALDPSDELVLPLAAGLIGLGGERYAIKDTSRVHVAARLAGPGGEVRFVDQTAPDGEPVRWRFYVETGAARALALARRLNVVPIVRR